MHQRDARIYKHTRRNIVKIHGTRASVRLQAASTQQHGSTEGAIENGVQAVRDDEQGIHPAPAGLNSLLALAIDHPSIERLRFRA